MILTQEIRQAFDILPDTEAQFYICAEDGEKYDVCLVQTARGARVLKCAKGNEAEIYQTLLTNCPCVPYLYTCKDIDGKTYLLLSEAAGQPAMQLERTVLIKIIDALVAMQEPTWQDAPKSAGYGFEAALASRKKRGQYLQNAALDKAYGTYLARFADLPRALCHDDLLPFNALVCDTGATLIDWEVAGILPYPCSLARLLAHADPTPDAFFQITEADRSFAIDYYYERLIAHKGISYADYRYTLDLFFLYEYAEWIMLGHKYGDTDSERYRRNLALATALASKL